MSGNPVYQISRAKQTNQNLSNSVIYCNIQVHTYIKVKNS